MIVIIKFLIKILINSCIKFNIHNIQNLHYNFYIHYYYKFIIYDYVHL